MEKNKEVFTVKFNDADVELAILKPSAQDQTEAQNVFNKTWAQAVSAGSPVRAALPRILKDQKLWSDEDQEEITVLGKDILKIEKKLKSGGREYKNLDEAHIEAKYLRIQRNKLNELLMRRSVLDNYSAEGQAENARLNYLIYACTVYNKDRKRFFKNLDDYYARSNEESCITAANKYMSFIHNIDVDFEKKYPENTFLLQYGFMNDKLQLVNSEGKAVDTDDNLINEFGQRIDEDGNIININNDVVNEDGTFKVEFVPFLDENGEEIKPKVLV